MSDTYKARQQRYSDIVDTRTTELTQTFLLAAAVSGEAAQTRIVLESLNAQFDGNRIWTYVDLIGNPVGLSCAEGKSREEQIEIMKFQLANHLAQRRAHEEAMRTIRQEFPDPDPSPLEELGLQIGCE